MKQTKLREPILYTSLWVVSVISTVIFFSGYIPDTGIMRLDMILGCTLAITLFYSILGGIYVLSKRSDRHKTRDMKIYIRGEIKDIDKCIEELQEEKKELLSSLPN